MIIAWIASIDSEQKANLNHIIIIVTWKWSLLKLQTSHRRVADDYKRLQTSQSRVTDDCRRVVDESQTTADEPQMSTYESLGKFFWIHL